MQNMIRRFGKRNGAEAEDISIFAPLVATAPVVPIVATVGTITAYLVELKVPSDWRWYLSPGALAVLLGGLLALLVCGVAMFTLRRFAEPEQANPDVYHQLLARLDVLSERIDQLGNARPLDVDEQTWRAALGMALRHRNDVARSLDLPVIASAGPIAEASAAEHRHAASERDRSLRWAFATGYVDLWRRVHRAEEALIEAEGTVGVVGGALYDEMRIEDSHIDNEESLLRKLRRAVEVLSPGAVGYLNQRERQLEVSNSGSEEQRRREARVTLLKVRRALHEFRDDRWEGLARLRNHLYESVTILGLMAYVLLALAVIMGAPPYSIMAASVFFLIGALIGLFNRLRIDGQISDSSRSIRVISEDFGLTRARLIHAPLISGLAAVGGVVVAALIPNALRGDVLQPQTPTPTPTVTVAITSTPSATATPTATATGATPTSTATIAPVAGGNLVISSRSEQQPVLFSRTTLAQVDATPTATRTPSPLGGAGDRNDTAAAEAQPSPEPATSTGPLPPLHNIFNLEKFLMGIIWAAIFGLTPSGIITAITRQAEQYRSDLRSTDAPENPNGR